MRPCAPKHARGFTLIETLAVISFIAALIGLLVPVLSDSRVAARKTVSLANLRYNAAVFHVYATDYRELAPYYVDPRDLTPVIVVESRGIIQRAWYFMAANLWNLALADQYFGGDPYPDSAFPPAYPYGVFDRDQRVGPTPYAYTCSFLAAPTYWNSATRTGRDQWSAIRIDSVAFPSAKVMLASEFTGPRSRDGTVPPDPPPRLWKEELGMADGSARAVAPHSIVPGHPTGDGLVVAEGHRGAGTAGTHTVDGVQGRDIR
jgi:type II secretory pathway pseudopilin PulG